MVINRAFNGKLNLDTPPYRMPPSDYSDALNITRDSQTIGNDKYVTNIAGNTLADYTLPSGTNKRIGSKADNLRNRIYYWIWNSNNHDLLLYFNKNTGTITKLIENITDTDGEDVLQFDPSYRINHADIIYRDEGDLLSWTEGSVSPREVNVRFLEEGNYSVIKTAFIEAAKRPPLVAPLAAYGSDTARNANNLRRKLFQFTTRWVYDNYEKSTFSIYSKIPLPVGYYGSDNDIDTNKNNFITITVPTGDENVKFIEVAMRSNIANAWSDFVMVISLDKEQLGIPDNNTYSYLFYNDLIYPPIDIEEAIQLFDWLPRKAFAQCLPNGNVKNYAAITENYNNYPVGDLDVTITTENETNVPPDTDPATMTYTNEGNGVYEFTVGGTIIDGTLFRIRVYIPPSSGGPITGDLVVAQYTSVPADTIPNVVTQLFASVPIPYQDGMTSNTFSVSIPATSSIISVEVVPSYSGSSISTEKTWLWATNYVFGLVYVDEQNRDMPAVTTWVNPVDSDNDFLVTTGEFSLDGSNDVETPVITAEINHLPPAGAVAYYWVRRRLTFGTFMMYETCDFQEDTDFMYFCLANIEYYKEQNTQFIYGTAPITDESRLKILAGITSGAYNGNVWNQDYEILGTVTRTLTSGTSPDDDKLFIKVKKPASSISPAYTANMLVMVYTPALNPTTLADSGFWEWGERYDIYELDDVKYHRGLDQDQTDAQPATFTWAEGDVYFHQRPMNRSLIATATLDTLNIMDANYSDYFDSAVNDNGRAQVIEVNAKETYYPTLDRFSMEFQSGTTVNQLNRFFFDNQDEYDRSFGDIRKLFIEGRYMYVFQKFDIGVVPILTQVVRDVSGNPLEANSDQLLNRISYPYIGKVGIGNVPESFGADKYAKYGVDNNKGVVWRLSRDGITILSIVYECNAFFVNQLEAYKTELNNGAPPPSGVYTGDPTVYGVFDGHANRYIMAFEEINRYADVSGFLYYLSDLGLDEIIYFPQFTPVNGTRIIIGMSATNGDSQTLTYDVPNGTSTVDVAQLITEAINDTENTLFSAVDITTHTPSPPLPDTDLFGSRISNIAGFGVTLNISIEGNLLFHQDPFTITFAETRDASEGFESKMSYLPEGMECLNNLLVSFKNGALWRHDSNTYCNFYNTQYNTFITSVFNDNPVVKKSFVALKLTANTIWECPLILTQLNSYGSTPQQSELIEADFELVEGEYDAALLHDVNSDGGINNGDDLKGGYAIIKFMVENASDFVYLNTVSLKYLPSPLNIS